MARVEYDQGALGAKLVVLAQVALLVAGCARGGSGASYPDEMTVERLEQARAAEAERRYDRADALYERARSEAPDPRSRGYASLLHGRALAAWGQEEDALAALEDAVTYAPKLAAAWHDLGVLRYRAGQVEGAELALRRAMAMRADDPRPRIALAALYVNTQRFDEARSLYRELRELELPPRVRAAIGEAEALLDEQQARDREP